MNKVLSIILLCFAVFIGEAAFAFDSGSTGADGAFSPTTSTEVELPPDGVLNYTVMNIPAGVTVTFKRNASNTPVYILATGDVTIAGTINLDGSAGSYLTPGKGGNGGFDGGVGAFVASCGGKGLGPGGGNPGTVSTSYDRGSGGGGGGFSGLGTGGGTFNTSYTSGGSGGQTYGNVNNFPLIGGSGGGGGCASSWYIGVAGGGGGGAILIASSGTINVTGSITTNGGSGASYGWCCWTYNGGGGGGSGGAIRLVADTIKGEGSLSASGGGGGTGGYYNYINGGGGSAGRIRLEANTLYGNVGTSPPYAVFAAHPLSVIPAVAPSLRIAKVGGINIPDYPTGAYGSPDIVLPSSAVNPTDIFIEAVNIPVGTVVTVTATPEYGVSTTATATLSGTEASSTATAQVTLSKRSVSILMVTATYILQTAANQPPLYAGGEKVAKIKVTAVFGGQPSITYITESGREIPADT